MIDQRSLKIFQVLVATVSLGLVVNYLFGGSQTEEVRLFIVFCQLTILVLAVLR